MASGWSTDAKLTRDAAFAPAPPQLSDKALELERRARALQEVEREELLKAAELNVLSPTRLQHAPTAGAASERGNDPQR